MHRSLDAADRHLLQSEMSMSRPRDAEKSRNHSLHGCFVEANKTLAGSNTHS